LLPTPAAGNFNDGEDLESWEARRQRNLAKGINGNGQGTPLGVAVSKLLPTPRSTDGTKGGPNQRGSSGDLMLPSAVVQLLLTPNATDGQGGPRAVPQVRSHRGNDHGPRLRDVVPVFRTPTSQLAVNGGSQHPDKRKAGGHGPTLADEVEHLLPTPMATDAGENPAPNARANTTRWGGVNSLGALGRSGFRSLDVRLTGEVMDWGPYARAVLRWAQVTDALPPAPVEPGKTGMRLSPAFVEWMQGLPAGWVTGIPELSRNAQLKALGNGVVPQQAVRALLIMLPRVSGLCPMP